MAKTSITRRWLINSLGIILIILIALEIVFAFSMRNYLYSAVYQEMSSRANAYAGLMVKYADLDSEQYAQQIRSLVENFDEKDKVELMIVDPRGDITLTSSGFAPDNTLRMPDYDMALEQPSGYGDFEGVLPTGENFLAISVLSPKQNDEISAIRLMVSLSLVERQVLLLIALTTLMGIAIIFFVVFSSSYFINSIVIPVGEVSKIARRIAAGDFSTKLQKKNDDEIGELCDVINYMAGELSAAEKLKNDFISQISHELRTPMTAIRGWGETVLSSSDDPETVRRGTQVILSESERLAGMVEELLDFSRMQSGRLTLVMNRMDLLAELEEAVIMFTDRAHREGMILEDRLPEDLPLIAGDANRLKQVFVNVIDNAFKYSDSGDTIIVTAEHRGDEIDIRVEDTGLGISKEDLPKVKEKFYKGNQSRRGSGIGLAVVDEIVRLHGGRLEIQSEEHVGTTVIITLPVYAWRRDAAVKGAAEEEPQPTQGDEFGEGTHRL